MQYLTDHWLIVLLALLAAIAVGWFVFHAARRTRVTGARRDVLDEGAAPAARNQALIDAPAAAPPVAVPPVAASPAALPVAHAASTGTGDDLARIKGVGPRLVAQLHQLGITRFAQIAAWSEGDIDRIDSQLGRFQGRIRRDHWVEQARLLAAGDAAGFAARFGNVN